MRPKKGNRWIQGNFKPVNPKKYAGDPTNIQYRSSWELRVFSRLDTDPDIVAWGSEELVVPYYDPVTKKTRRYFPDLLVKYRDGRVEMWEIKPSTQTLPPKLGKKHKKTIIFESQTYATNIAKWDQAKKFCEDKKWTFVLLTEKGRIIY